MKQPTILDFIRKVLHEDISPAQAALLAATYGLPAPPPMPSDADWLTTRGSLDALYGLPIGDEQDPFQRFTERPKRLRKRQQDVTAVCGRRSGKTGRIGINVALFEALQGGHERSLHGAGERCTIPIIAQDLKMAGETLRTLTEKVMENPTLRDALAEKPTGDSIVFSTRCQILVKPCNFKASRGLHVPCAILDEIGVWDVEGANPDKAVVDSLRPAMATFPRRLLLKLSTPWVKGGGVLWDDFNLHYGKPDAPVLVWKAPTWYMNPSLGAEFFTAEYERDPEYARREYGAEFLSSEDSFLPWQAVQEAVDEGVFERPPEKGRAYFAALDVGYKQDSTVLVIGHHDGEQVVQDVGMIWLPPVSHEDMLYEVAQVCRRFFCQTLMGDQYCSEPLREGLLSYGIVFVEVTLNVKRAKQETPDARFEVGASKQDIYGALRTLVLQGRLRLVDSPRGLNELRTMEVKRSFSGSVQIGAPKGKHDDYPFALALMCWQAWQADEERDRPLRVKQRGMTLLDQVVEEGDPWDAEFAEVFLDELPQKTQDELARMTPDARQQWLRETRRQAITALSQPKKKSASLLGLGGGWAGVGRDWSRWP